MEPEHRFVDQNSTFQSSSSSSSASLDDIEPEVKDQFVKLADALKETNQNLLTFEFMLAQYRKLARIEPFNAEKDALLQGDLRQQADELGGSGTGREEVLEQLKCLTSAVNSLQPPATDLRAGEKTDMVVRLLDDLGSIRGQLQQLSQANEAVAFLRSKVDHLESALDEKTRLAEALTESHKRLTSQLTEERDRCQELDRKLESEKRAAAQVGKDITKYVERMSELEAKVRNQDPKVSELEKLLSAKCDECRVLSEQNYDLKQKLTAEKNRSSEMEARFEAERSSSRDRSVSVYVEKVEELERKVRSDLKEKESLQTTIDILKDQLHESRRLNDDSRNFGLNDSSSTFSNTGGLCRSCLESDRIEEVTRKVEELAVDIQRRTDTDVARLASQNRQLESDLRQEQNLRHSLETKVAVCETEIRYEKFWLLSFSGYIGAAP